MNFRRIFPDQPAGHINLGLIQLHSAADAEAVRRRLEAALENDVLVMTKEAFTRTAYVSVIAHHALR